MKKQKNGLKNQISLEDFDFIVDLLIAHSKKNQIQWHCTSYVLALDETEESTQNTACLMHGATFSCLLGAANIEIDFLLQANSPNPVQTVISFVADIITTHSQKQFSIIIDTKQQLSNSAILILNEIYRSQSKWQNDLSNVFICIPHSTESIECFKKEFKKLYHASTVVCETKNTKVFYDKLCESIKKPHND